MFNKFTNKLVRRIPSPSSTDKNSSDDRWLRNRYLVGVLVALLFCTSAYAETETTEDVTEKDAGATHLCGRNNSACTYDPRSDINSDGGTDDDIVYWDQHGKTWNITNDINSFMTEEQMLQGFTMDSSIGLRDRNYVGGDAFSIQIKVTDGTTTYSDTQNFTTSAGQSYETITSQLIVPENTQVTSNLDSTQRRYCFRFSSQCC